MEPRTLPKILSKVSLLNNIKNFLVGIGQFISFVAVVSIGVFILIKIAWVFDQADAYVKWGKEVDRQAYERRYQPIHVMTHEY